MQRIALSRFFWFGFYLLLVGCSIIPEQTFEDLPELKFKKIQISRDDGKVLNGTVVYEGPAGSPTKITVQWDAGFKLFQIPITDSISMIEKTIYEVENNRIVGITNVNNRGVDVRTEELNYDGEGYLEKHTRQEIHVGGVSTYENFFHYREGVHYLKLDSVSQTQCIPTGCVKGLIKNSLIIIPYDDKLPYSDDPANSTNDNNKNRSWIGLGYGGYLSESYEYESQNLINYRNPKTGSSAQLNFKELYEKGLTDSTDTRDEFNYWDLRFNKQDVVSVNLNLRKAEYLLNLYYYVGNYILPQKIYYTIAGDDSPHREGSYGIWYEPNPMFWVLSRLSLPIDQYNFSTVSKQKFATGDRSLTFRLITTP